MNHIEIEKKWNKKWADDRLYSFNGAKIERKKYILEMFSYPSGAKLHIGHWYNFALSDSYARFKKAQGYEVFEPMGFDSFGLPAENYAIKTGTHPHDSTEKNIAAMEVQLKKIGTLFDWDYELFTSHPDYYKWTQWLFLQLYKNGLAERKNAPVNWCPSCGTVLANEQVVDNKCERCDSEVTRKNLTQWFFKITAYADELLDKLDTMDWPEKTKSMQRNWIGRSEGAELVFSLAPESAHLAAAKGLGQDIKVFTTRADTLFGCSYVVLSPEHPLADAITAPDKKAAVEAYKLDAAKSTEIERLSSAREKTGVFCGAHAVHPCTGEKLPVWLGDYVLASYGTGAVMGVPAHDSRDFVFAQKYNLPIIKVIEQPDADETVLPYCEDGKTANSGAFSGLTSEGARRNIVADVDKRGKGRNVVNYRLRDWLVSRQRFWGAPIPIVHCEHCGMVPVPEEQLPVVLPYDVKFTPDGSSPLARSEKFMSVPCPKCGKPARREPDTLDTFVCSSWYYLRYFENKNDKAPFTREIVNKMLPVDKYIGGPEHACMHLLYARFITKALRDMGYLDFDEPFKSLVHQGIILGPDGNRMSKSHGNVISPDGYVSDFGSDIFRTYLAFGFKYIEGGPWSDDGIRAVAKWLERVERTVLACTRGAATAAGGSADAEELDYVRHSAIKAVSADMEEFSFNTAVARMMELTNALSKFENDGGATAGGIYHSVCLDLLRLLAPLAPHFCEELWQQLGEKYSIINAGWPAFDAAKTVRKNIELAVQVNSKIRAKITVPAELTPAQIEQKVRADAEILSMLGGAAIKKIIVVPGRLVNIIV